MSGRAKSPAPAVPRVLQRLTDALVRSSGVGRLPRKRLHGDTILVEADPVLEHYSEAIFLPQRGALLTDDPPWGLFDRNGQPIEAAFYRRGPGPERIGSASAAPHSAETIARRDDAPYLYLGHFSAHYGHFLLSSLARLWPLVRNAMPAGCKFVYHAPEPPHLWFAIPFVAQMLRALGLRQDDFVFFTGPVRLGTLLVPGSSFEESHKAHRIHRTVGTEIGEKLLTTVSDGSRTAQPVYLSRTRLQRGTHRITNEGILVEALAKRGVAIAHPEELSLAEQVRLFDRHDVVVSLVGSALHTSLLTRRPNGLVGISMQPSLRSDYPLIDRLAGNRARYLFHTFQEEAGEQDGFHRSARFAQPKRVVDSVLRAIDAIA